MDIEALEKKELQKKQVTVAALFILALLLSLLFAYWMGALGIGPSSHVFVKYNFAGGLDRGSVVRLAGIKVGRVSDIKFFHAGEKDSNGDEVTNIIIKLEMSHESLSQLSDDTKFYINLAGLIGERYVEVVPGAGPIVQGGHTFRGVDPPRVDQLISQSFGIFGDMREFFKENKGDLKEMFTTLNDLSKNLNKMLGGLTHEQKEKMNTLLNNFAVMSEDLKSTVHSVASATSFMEANGAKEAWLRTSSILNKGDKISINDLRRLMLEDGVKVNFSSKKVPESSAKE